MTASKAKEILRYFGELALKYAKAGEIDTVANINASIADFVSQYEDVLNADTNK